MGSARFSSRAGLREWRPWEPQRREEEAPRPWLEAPSPYDYRPLDPPRAETQNDEGEEEGARVIIIDM